MAVPFIYPGVPARGFASIIPGVAALLGVLAMIGLVLAQPPDPPVTVTFQNHTAAAVDIFWVDFDGVEQNYGVLEPGWEWEQETFAGHLWRFRQNGQLLGAYVAGRDAQQTYAISLEMERSLSGDTPVAVVFQNNTPAAVEVFWVDYEGAEQGYGEIPPGQNMQMETAATHPWRFKQNGQVIGSYTAGRDPQQTYTLSLGETRRLGASDFQSDSPDPRIQSSPEGFTLPYIPISLWSKAEVYDLDKSQTLTLEFEAILADTLQEIIIAFSQSKLPWGTPGADALTVKTAWDEDVWFRTGFYENWLDSELSDYEGEIIHLDQWQRYRITLTRQDITLSVDGQEMARGIIGNADFPRKGHVGFIVYGHPDISEKLIAYRNITISGGLRAAEPVVTPQPVTQQPKPAPASPTHFPSTATQPDADPQASRGSRPVTPAGGPSTLSSPGRFYGLIIGVQDYIDPGVKDLDFPLQDAQNIINALTSYYTFDPQDIVFLKNPTKTQITEELDKLAEKVTPNDNLLIFYAGHGYWDEQFNQGFWLPADTKKNSRGSWLSNGVLKDYITGIRSKHTLLISDACFSGGIFKTRDAFGGSPNRPDRATEELYKYPSRKAMTSGAMKEVPDKSEFIKYFIKRLEENPDSYLPAQRLFSSLREPVINNSPNSQVPQFGVIRETGDEDGEFIFIRRK